MPDAMPPIGVTTLPSPPTLRLSTPEDLVVWVPYLVGYVPADSLVVVRRTPPAGASAGGVDGPRTGRSPGLRPAAVRVDLPAADTTGRDLRDFARTVAGWLVDLGHRRVVLTLWSADAALARRTVEALGTAMRRRGIGASEVLRVDAGRWWSLSCRRAACCPAEGTPYDSSTSAVAVAATVAGLTAAPSLQALRQVLEPVLGAERAAMAAAHERVREVLAARTDDLSAPALSRWLDADGRRRVRQALAGGGRVADPLELAWLAVHVARIPVRDVAWLRMRTGPLGPHRELWAELTRRAEPALTVAPACLFAVTAWLEGQGAMARVAVDVALAQDPGYSMALLVQELLDRGVPPSSWRTASRTTSPTDLSRGGQTGG